MATVPFVDSSQIACSMPCLQPGVGVVYKGHSTQPWCHWHNQQCGATQGASRACDSLCCCSAYCCHTTPPTLAPCGCGTALAGYLAGCTDCLMTAHTKTSLQAPAPPLATCTGDKDCCTTANICRVIDDATAVRLHARTSTGCTSTACTTRPTCLLTAATTCTTPHPLPHASHTAAQHTLLLS
jgi:hypothetical protein